MEAQAEPFDRARRRALRARAAAGYDDHAFLKDAMVAELVARVTETAAVRGIGFARLLDVGAHDGRLARALPASSANGEAKEVPIRRPSQPRQRVNQPKQRSRASAVT